MLLSEEANIIDAINEVDKIINGKGKFTAIPKGMGIAPATFSIMGSASSNGKDPVD